MHSTPWVPKAQQHAVSHWGVPSSWGMGLAALCWVKLPRCFEHLSPSRTTEAAALHRAATAFLLPARPPGGEIACRDAAESPWRGSWRAQPPICNVGNVMWTRHAPTQPQTGHLCPAAETKGMRQGAVRKPVLPSTPPAWRRQADAGPAPSACTAARRGANEKQGERQEMG